MSIQTTTQQRLRGDETGPRRPDPALPSAEVSLGLLLRRLAEDSRTLVQQEIALAKAEVREGVSGMAKASIVLVIGISLLAVGFLVLIAFFVIGLGILLDDRYWLSALIVSLFFLLVGAVMVFRGRSRLTATTIAPTHAIESMRESKKWAADELSELKQDLSNSPPEKR